jgi:hypothetical protein
VAVAHAHDRQAERRRGDEPRAAPSRQPARVADPETASAPTGSNITMMIACPFRAKNAGCALSA